jgi:beta-aspartyl-peptidase (threonine type)
MAVNVQGERPGAGAKVKGPDVVLVIHGGAGTLRKNKMTPALEKQYRAALEKALRAGHDVLQKDGSSSLDAVEAAVRVLEDSPLFNAGKGSVFTHEGRNELDAAVMDGKGKTAGAVACLTCIKNPVSAARAVMEKSGHVLLIGRDADLFATRQGLEVVDPSYFWTEGRWQELQEALRRGAAAAPPEQHVGTVGAVARDRHGHLAAATSTGGMTNKLPGRVGDTPLIGAGTYADNETCAVSATGDGEVFIRHVVAHDVAARMKYQKLSVQEAAVAALQEIPPEPGGVGGLIALDAGGNFAMPFNTPGMYRGSITADGKTHVAIYEE